MDDERTAGESQAEVTPSTAQPVDELVAKLAGGGRSEPGRFTLDRQRAREKLGDFQLPDNKLYLVQLVQALLTLGAKHITCRYDPDDLWLLADGQPWEKQDFDHLYEALLSGNDNRRKRAQRDLAIGLQAALQLDVAWVRVVSPAELGVVFLRRDTDSEDDFGIDEKSELLAEWPTSTSPIDDAATLMHVHYRRVVDSDLEDLTLEPPGIAEVRQRCARVAAELTINDVPVGDASFEAGFVEHVAVAGNGFRGALGMAAEGDPGATTLELMQDGVVRASHQLPLPGGLVARVEAPGLHRDLSQFDVLRDARYEDVVQAVERARERLLGTLAGRLKALPERLPAHAPRIRAVLCQVLGEGGYKIGQCGETDSSLVKRLLAAPLWPQYVSEGTTRPAAREAPRKLRTTKGLLLARNQGELFYHTEIAQKARHDLPRNVLYLPESQEQEWLKGLVPSGLTSYTGKAAALSETPKRRQRRTIPTNILIWVLATLLISSLVGLGTWLVNR